ncbi:hypothetical protein ACFTZI_20800 [Streptomyces decoyicus]|uniref:hypothetical protein n=1 Tax=Streptomyces decoyicus TaxID=249567 RepID=UPI0036344F68
MSAFEKMAFGPLGDAVKSSQEYTEGDPVGVFAASLSLFSAAINGYVVQPSGRPVAVWTVLVGRSKTGRKGFALNTAIAAVGRSISGFLTTRKRKGIKSGAALITTLYEVEQETLISEGGVDGRVVIIEDEWASVLRRANRDDDYYDNLIHAWDGAPMVNTTKGKDGRRNEQRVTSPLLGFHGHIQPARWASLVKGDAVFSGAFNRILPVLVDKSKNLPSSMKQPHTHVKESPALTKAYEWARKGERIMSLSPQAAERHDAYRDELDDRLADMPEARSALVERADENLLRIACVLAAATRKTTVSVKAWEAAREFVEYSMTSVDKLATEQENRGAKATKTLPELIREKLSNYAGEATSTLLLRSLGTRVTAASLKATVEDMDDVEMVTEKRTAGRGAPSIIYRLVDPNVPKAEAPEEPKPEIKAQPEQKVEATPAAPPKRVRKAAKTRPEGKPRLAVVTSESRPTMPRKAASKKAVATAPVDAVLDELASLF